MDRPFVGGGDKQYETNYDRIFQKKTPKEKVIIAIHKLLVRVILGRKI
jgi:hypothetical protein